MRVLSTGVICIALAFATVGGNSSSVSVGHSSGATQAQFVLIGKVVNASGDPIAGADVALYPYHVNQQQINRTIPGNNQVKTAKSDAEGSFTIPLTQNFSQTLAVSAPGFIPEIDPLSRDQSIMGTLRNAAPGTTFTRTITLQQKSTRSGIVADENGQPLAGVTVQAFPAQVQPGTGMQPGRIDETMTDGDGRFVLEQVPPGPLALHFSAPGFANAYLTTDAGQIKNIAINLSRGATVSGHLTQAGSGQAVGGEWLRLTSASPPYRPGSNELQPFPRNWSGRALSGESGSFSFRNVPPGKYNLQVENNPGSSNQMTGIWNPGGAGTLSVNVPETGDPDPIAVSVFSGYTIAGRVVESGTTNSVAGARVWLMDRYPNPYVDADANGNFQFEHIFGQGTLRLSAQADGYVMNNPNNHYARGSTITVSLELPTSTTVAHINIPMNREQVIKGIVLDAQTSVPVSGATILPVDNRYSPRSQEKPNQVTSGPDGSFSISLFPSESIRLRAEAPGYAIAISNPIRKVSETQVVLAMHRGVTLSGTVVDPSARPVADAVISGNIHVDAPRAYSGNTNSYNETLAGKTMSAADGTFEIAALPPGARLLLYSSKEGFAASISQSYSIVEGSDITSVTLELRTAKILAGRVLDKEGKPVEQATVSASSIGTSGNAFARTSSGGVYRMETLPDAPVDVQIMHPQHGNEWFYEVAVGRENVDFRFGKGTNDGGRQRYERDRENARKNTGVTLHGKAVDYKTGLPVKDFRVIGNYGLRVELHKDRPGEFTVTGLAIRSPYQSIRIIASGYATYDSGALYIEAGQTEVEKTFKLGPGGSITGRAVEKGSGKPVAGVIVSLGADLTSARSGPDGQEKVAPAVSAGDGTFTLTGVGQGRKVVAYEPPPETGFVKMSQPVDVVYNEVTDLKDVEFGTGGTISGKLVRTPGDVPIPNARITLRDEGNTVTNADGAFEFTNLVNGLYYVEAPEYGANSWIGVEQLETKELTLEVGTGKLTGLVMRAGKPVACAVTLQKIGYGQSVARFINADNAGRFVVEGLAPGRWSVTMANRGGAEFSAEDFVVMPESGESVEKTFTLPSGALQVTVVDAGGQPVDGATVIVRQESGADAVMQASGQTRQTNSNGITSFDGLDAGSYSITATDREGLRGSKPNVAIQNDGSAAETITLEAAAGGTLVSTALNLSNGKPVPTAWCYLFDEQGQMFEHTRQRDELGVVTIENIPAGTYRVQVSALGFSASEKTIEIRSGEAQSIDDVLYPAGALRWALRTASGAPAVGVRCTLKPSDPDSIESERSGVTNAEGVFVARGLMQGAYIAEAKGPAGSARALINIYSGNASDQVTLLK